MVAECANPQCRAQFLYMGTGKLFALRRGCEHHFRVEFFWLCRDCAGADPASFLPDGARPAPVPWAQPSRREESDAQLHGSCV